VEVLLGARGVLPGSDYGRSWCNCCLQGGSVARGRAIGGVAIRTGALTGIQHKFIVRQGGLWPELQDIIREESTDLLVVGTHGRHGIAKLFLGSIAEQIFRRADCPVLTLGPHTDGRPWFGTSSMRRTFLFATDFGHASLHGLPQAIAAANQFGAK